MAVLKKVYLSPSMQKDNHYVIGGTEEYYMNLIADVTSRCLKRHKVLVYRNNPNTGLITAVNEANRANVDVYVAMHSNAGGGHGCEVYYKTGNAKSKKIAGLLYLYVAPLTPTEDRGIKPTTRLYEVTKPIAPAALIEYAFHDNMIDAKFIKGHIRDLGIATARGILKYLGITYVPIKPSTKPKLAQQSNPSINPQA